MPEIKGLPEGVTCVRIGIATPDEYEIYGDEITKGARAGSITQIIVEPAPGWMFWYDIRSLSFRPVKKLAAPTSVTASVKFTVENQRDLDTVNGFLDRAREIPGFVKMEVPGFEGRWNKMPENPGA